MKKCHCVPKYKNPSSKSAPRSPHMSKIGGTFAKGKKLHAYAHSRKGRK